MTLPSDEKKSIEQLLVECWESEWYIRFESVGMNEPSDQRGWEVSIVNFVTNRRIGHGLAEVTASSPRDALEAAIAMANAFDKPRWHDDGTPYGVWLYPGDDGYDAAE